MSPASLARTLRGERFKLPGHLRVINRYLTYLAFGHIERLMIFAPPRHGKSHLTSETFPAWYLANFPDHRIMFISYNHTIARRFGRICRDVLQHEIGPLLGLQVDPDVHAAGEWQVDDSEGGMVSVGPGGALTARGADVILIDDPMKGHEDAMSPQQRESLWDFYISTAYSRLEPGGKIILIQTRWHADDLAGRLQDAMESGEGEDWNILKLPAIATEDEDWGIWQRRAGEPLWPERFPLKRLETIRRVQGPFWWSSLYAQDPIPEEGTMFRRGWFEIIETDPGDCYPVVRYWDFAATDPKHGGDPDYTVGTKYGYSPGLGKWVVLDVVRDRRSPGEIETIVRQTAQLDGRDVQVWIEEEPGSSGKAVSHQYRKNVLRGFTMFAHKPSGKKHVRAIPVSAEAQAGDVVLVRGDWIRDWLAEIEVFPLGAHDDQVDSWSGAHDVLANSMTQHPKGVQPIGFPQSSKWNRPL